MRALATTLAATLLLYTPANTPKTKPLEEYTTQPIIISNEYEETTTEQKEQGFITRNLQKGRSLSKRIEQELHYTQFFIQDTDLNGTADTILLTSPTYTTRILKKEHEQKGYYIIIPRNSMNKKLQETADEYLQWKKEKYEVEQALKEQLRK
jgi:diadenosine tetraphosphate (Ap4A) HIT family hydrolase